MTHQRLTLKDADGTETIVYLEPRTPLDGHGGKLRQGFNVYNRHYETLGRITRYRNDNGTATGWESETRSYVRTDHPTRAAALRHLSDTRKA